MKKSWFMIRDKISGKHLPCRTGRKASYTSLELTDERPPRLFSKRGHATQAMACWNKGVLTPKFVTPTQKQQAAWGLQLLDSVDDRTNQYEVHPVEGRDKTELEVIEITIGDLNNST